MIHFRFVPYFLMTFFVISNLFILSKIFAFPDFDRTDYLWVEGKQIPIQDGMKLDNMNLHHTEIHWRCNILSNASFQGSDMTGANLNETAFRNCSFKNTNLTSVVAKDANFINCVFDGAIIDGAVLHITRKQLITTKSYQVRFMYHQGIEFCEQLEEVDFSGCYLKNSLFHGSSLKGCNFTDANIMNVFFGPKITRQQLEETNNFKQGKLLGIVIWNTESDFSGIDFSRFNLTGSHFRANLSNANFTDAVITDCNFDLAKITLSQIKSTWNYKMGRMNGIVLPPEIKQDFDAEKEKKNE